MFFNKTLSPDFFSLNRVSLCSVKKEIPGEMALPA